MSNITDLNEERERRRSEPHLLGDCIAPKHLWNKYKNQSQEIDAEDYEKLCESCLDKATDPSYCRDGECRSCARDQIFYHIAEFGLNGKSLYYLKDLIKDLEPNWKPGDPNPEDDPSIADPEWVQDCKEAWPGWVETKYWRR